MTLLNLRTKECPSEDSPTVPWLDTFWLQTRLGRMMEDDSVSPECRSAENPCSSPHSQVGSLLLYGEGKAGTSWYQSMSALLTKQKTGRFNKMFQNPSKNESCYRDPNFPIQLSRHRCCYRKLLCKIAQFAKRARQFSGKENHKSKLFDSAVWKTLFFKRCEQCVLFLMAFSHCPISERLSDSQRRRGTHSPADAVSCEWVTASGTVTRSAAIVSKAPVSHHAPVTMWPCHPRLARAVTIARVTEGH